MKKITKFIKDFLVLREEDKLYMIPWEFIKWIWTEPTAYKYKGTILIPHDESRWSWKRATGWYPWVKDKAAADADTNEDYEDGKSPVKQSK